MNKNLSNREHVLALRAANRISAQFPNLRTLAESGLTIGSPEHAADNALIALNAAMAGIASRAELAQARQLMQDY